MECYKPECKISSLVAEISEPGIIKRVLWLQASEMNKWVKGDAFHQYKIFRRKSRVERKEHDLSFVSTALSCLHSTKWRYKMALVLSVCWGLGWEHEFDRHQLRDQLVHSIAMSQAPCWVLELKKLLCWMTVYIVVRDEITQERSGRVRRVPNILGEELDWGYGQWKRNARRLRKECGWIKGKFRI